MRISRRIVAAVLVFAAIGYLVAYTIFTHPYFATADDTSDVAAQDAESATQSSPPQRENEPAERLSKPPNTQPEATTPSAATVSRYSSADAALLPEPAEPNQLTRHGPAQMQSTITALSDQNQLHGSLARSLMAEQDFDELIRRLEKSSPEAYERQAGLLDLMNQLNPVLDNTLRPRVLNCNEVFCGASFDYDSEEVVLQFIGEFLATGAEPGAIAIQPVTIDNSPQLRMIIHRSASYQVD